MTTLPDQTIPLRVWTSVTGLVNGTSYALQNKTAFEMLLVEESAAPGDTDFRGRSVSGGNLYNFTKGVNPVFVRFARGNSGLDEGLIAVNEGA